MRKVPFYANHEDGMHCMLAVYRTIFDHFLYKKMGWSELEAFTGFKPGQAAWSLKSITQFANMDFDIRMIEPFDYAQFARRGEEYLYEIWGNDKLEWQVKHTNILDIKPQIPDFLNKVAYENRSATLDDIDTMLTEGRLVSVMLNAGALNGLDEYYDHSILIIGSTQDSYIAHDPGGGSVMPQPARHIKREKLWQSMGGDENTSEVTGFKLKPRRNLRLDHHVIAQYPLLSRAYAVRLIEDGKVRVNNRHSKPGYKIREQDTITIDYDQSAAQDIPEITLPILYEDDDCIVIDKPIGVLTHSKGGFTVEGTVASFLRSRLQEDTDTPADQDNFVNTGIMRAGIVHRLDRATSGVIICAKTPEALSWLQRQFHDRLAKKTYMAVVKGQLKPEQAIIDMPIARNPKAPATFRVSANGKSAVTAYKQTQTNERYSLVELKPETGRTHQLRVHLAEQKHPIVGDVLYDGEPAERLYLHAYSLTITLPEGETKTFTAALPPEFQAKTKLDTSDKNKV